MSEAEDTHDDHQQLELCQLVIDTIDRFHRRRHAGGSVHLAVITTAVMNALAQSIEAAARDAVKKLPMFLRMSADEFERKLAPRGFS